MRQRLYPTLTAFLSVLVCTACGDALPPVERLEFHSADLVDGEVAITKDRLVFIGVYGIDSQGDKVDISDGVTWSSSDDELVEVHSVDEAGAVIGHKDWFDTLEMQADGGAPEDDAGGAMDSPDGGPVDGGMPEPYEPRADVTVEYNGRSARVPVAIVINADGTWQIFLNDNAEPVSEQTFRQSGRMLRNEVADAEGRIEGDRLDLRQGPLMLSGTFVSRTAVEGTFPAGTWRALRVPEVTQP